MLRLEELAQSLATGNEEAAQQFRKIILSGNQMDMGPVFLALRYQREYYQVSIGCFALNLLEEHASALSPYVIGQLLYLVVVQHPGSITGQFLEAVRAVFGEDRAAMIVSHTLWNLSSKIRDLK